MVSIHFCNYLWPICITLSDGTTGKWSSVNSTYSKWVLHHTWIFIEPVLQLIWALLSPLKVVMTAAGRMGMCCWHWSDADQSALFGDTSVVNLLYWNTELVDDAKACTNIYMYICIVMLPFVDGESLQILQHILSLWIKFPSTICLVMLWVSKFWDCSDLSLKKSWVGMTLVISVVCCRDFCLLVVNSCIHVYN